MITQTPTLLARLTAVMDRFGSQRVLVVGDIIADQFVYGEISRVSREAPVLILRHERTETAPGGAANCALNLSSLGARTAIVGIVGDDEAGRAVTETLSAAGVDCEGVVNVPARRTTTKARVLAGHAHSARQQVIRVDYEPECRLNPRGRDKLIMNLREADRSAEAVILSDYNYGVVDTDVAAALVNRKETSGSNLFIDSRFNLLSFPGFTSATPNEDEVEHVLGRRLEDVTQVEQAAAELRESLNYEALLVTRGSKGMVLSEREAGSLLLDASGSTQAVDVTGAGDTVIATYALAVAAGATFADAARLANYAGGIVVMKRGTASVNLAELEASVRSTVQDAKRE